MFSFTCLCFECGTIAPLITFVIKPVYKMLYKGNETIGQPLEKIKIACIPNGLLLTRNPII